MLHQNSPPDLKNKRSGGEPIESGEKVILICANGPQEERLYLERDTRRDAIKNYLLIFPHSHTDANVLDR